MCLKLLELSSGATQSRQIFLLLADDRVKTVDQHFGTDAIWGIFRG